MVYKFKSGKYQGKTIEEVALIDYCHLNKMLENSKRKNQNDFITKNIEDIINRLNNFVPAVTCRYPDCKNIADYLTIAITEGTIPRGDFNRYGVTDSSISKDYVWCEKHKDIHTGHEKAAPYEIKFDTLLELKTKYPIWQEWVNGIKKIQKVILECAGFKGNKTAEKCSNFIYNLPQKGGILSDLNIKTPSQVIPEIMDKLKGKNPEKKQLSISQMIPRITEILADYDLYELGDEK